MDPEDIPQELIDILDDRAGKKHSRQGSVVRCLAEILTKFDEIRAEGEQIASSDAQKGGKKRQ